MKKVSVKGHIKKHVGGVFFGGLGEGWRGCANLFFGGWDEIPGASYPAVEKLKGTRKLELLDQVARDILSPTRYVADRKPIP